MKAMRPNIFDDPKFREAYPEIVAYERPGEVDMNILCDANAAAWDTVTETVDAWPTFLWPLVSNYINTTEDVRRFDCAHAGDMTRFWRWDSYDERTDHA